MAGDVYCPNGWFKMVEHRRNEKPSLYEHEENTILKAEKLLQKRSTAGLAAEFELLLNDYKKILRKLRQLVKHSDRMERKLNNAAKDAESKNQQLEALSKQLSKYLSPQIYDSIFSGARGVELVSARKKLSVFFSDLCNFTQTTEKIQSEDLTQLLNFYLSEMSSIALEYGATIDKYVGDAIVIFFGDPNSNGVKEDATQCVEMALAMRRKMRELEHRWGTFGLDEPLQYRMGIHTGFCTVGNFGSDIRMDYTVIGSGVNLAARLESAAKPNGLLISLDTYNLVKDELSFVESEQINAKGFAEPIRTFKPISDEPIDLLSFELNSKKVDLQTSELTLDELKDIEKSLNLGLQQVKAIISSK